MNSSGKTFTIFLIVIAVLLVSLTTIAVFFFLKEIELNKVAQDHVEQLEDLSSKLQTEIKEAKKQNFILQEKIKEAEEQIESKIEDYEMEQGLNEELKKLNKELKDQLSREGQRLKELESKFNADLGQAESRIVTLQQELDALTAKNNNLQQLCEQYESQLQLGPQPVIPPDQPAESAKPATPAAIDVELDKIVVVPLKEGEGTVLDVDQENEFVIVSLGEKDGVLKESVLSVYRDDAYLGDILVTQVLPDMSAADFVAPLTSQQVRKDDRVMMKIPVQ